MSRRARRVPVRVAVVVALLGPPLSMSACAEARGGGVRLLVTSGFTDQVFVLDAASGDLLDSVSLDLRPGERDEPHGVATLPDGGHWYATVAHGEPTLWKFETAGMRLVGRLRLPLRGAARVRLSPDGALAAVTDYWLAGEERDGQVALVGTEDLEVMEAAEVCPAPHDAAFSPTGDRLAVTCAGGVDVVFLAVPGLEEVGRVPVGSRPGAKPLNVAWRADGSAVAVSVMGDDAVVELFPDGGEVRRWTVARPAQVAAAGARWVVAARGSGEAAILEPDGGVRAVRVGGAHPHGVAVAPDGRTVYLTWEGDVDTTGGVAAVDVESGAVRWRQPVGIYTLGVAVLPSGGTP